MHELHPFARFIAILVRGRTKSRSIDFEESRESMRMLLQGKALSEQIGAFLMLLRLKEATPQEIAGMALAVKDLTSLPKNCPKPDIDWSSYLRW